MAGDEIESKGVDDQYDGSFVCRERGAPILTTFISVWKRQPAQEKSLGEQVYPYAVNKGKPEQKTKTSGKHHFRIEVGYSLRENNKTKTVSKVRETRKMNYHSH